eukprot:jgi/Ulvmu1/1846/UM012_0002.1
MAPTALPGSWEQRFYPIDGCSKLKLHQVMYKADSGPKQWFGIRQESRQADSSTAGARQERVVCIVKSSVTWSGSDPFILLLAQYMPSMNKLCLTLPSGANPLHTGEALEAAVQSILYEATGDRPVVRMVAMAPGECVGMPRLSPERVKVVTVEISRRPYTLRMPWCGLRNGPTSALGIAADTCIADPVTAKGHVPGAQKLCFLPLAGISTALADLRGRFDHVDCEVELVAAALAAQQPRGSWYRGCLHGLLAGTALGVGLGVALTWHLDVSGRLASTEGNRDAGAAVWRRA